MTTTTIERLLYLCCCGFVIIQLSKASPVLTNDVLVMSGNVNLQEMNSRNDRSVMYIAVDKNDEPCSALIPDKNPVCVFCLNGACEGIRRGQKHIFVSTVEHMFCRLKYRIIYPPNSQSTCRPFMRHISVERSILTRSS